MNWLPIATSIAAVACSAVIGAVFIVSLGADPVAAYASMVRGAFGSVNGISETLVRATPLIFLGLGAAVAFRARVWNIGGEGQLVLGALGAALVGLYLPFPSWISLPAAILLGCLFGGAWAGIAGFLKARMGTNEIIITIMMNFIAIYAVSYMNHGPLREAIGIFPQSDVIARAAWLPKLLPPTRIHAGIILAIVVTVLVHILLSRSALGYRIAAVGNNAEAARYAGIRVPATIVLVMLISGGLAGLAGVNEISGIHHRLIDNISNGLGFTGIVVALLGRLNPFGIVLAAILFGALNVGADAMERTMGLPSSFAFVLQALVVLFIIAGHHLNAKGTFARLGKRSTAERT